MASVVSKVGGLAVGAVVGGAIGFFAGAGSAALGGVFGGVAGLYHGISSQSGRGISISKVGMIAAHVIGGAVVGAGVGYCGGIGAGIAIGGSIGLCAVSALDLQGKVQGNPHAVDHLIHQLQKNVISAGEDPFANITSGISQFISNQVGDKDVGRKQ